MTPEQNPTESQSREAVLPSACMTCGGDLHLKVTGSQAVSYCTTCHVLTHPEVTVTFDGLQVSFRHVGHA